MGIAKMGSFKDIFKTGFGEFMVMAKGGTVPGGYPNDTFPAMLTTGETVLTPEQSRTFGGGNIEITIKTDYTRGEHLYWIVEEYKRKRSNSFG